MPRVYKPQYAFRVTYICDECNTGEMQHTGMVLTSNPLQYPHKCDTCGFEETMKNGYPHMAYRDTPEAEK